MCVWEIDLQFLVVVLPGESAAAAVFSTKNFFEGDSLPKAFPFSFQILENEIFKFEEQICDFEEDLSNEANDIPEEIRDSILAAIGKGKLLMSQKLTQFRGLCDKNIVSASQVTHLSYNQCLSFFL